MAFRESHLWKIYLMGRASQKIAVKGYRMLFYVYGLAIIQFSLSSYAAFQRLQMF